MQLRYGEHATESQILNASDSLEKVNSNVDQFISLPLLTKSLTPVWFYHCDILPVNSRAISVVIEIFDLFCVYSRVPIETCWSLCFD